MNITTCIFPNRHAIVLQLLCCNLICLLTITNKGHLKKTLHIEFQNITSGISEHFTRNLNFISQHQENSQIFVGAKQRFWQLVFIRS